MTIPTYSSFGLCKLSRILAGTHSFWACRTVLFHWLSKAKRSPFLRARNLKQRTKVSRSLALQCLERLISRVGSNGRCNTIWYNAVFKGGVYEARETVWA